MSKVLTKLEDISIDKLLLETSLYEPIKISPASLDKLQELKRLAANIKFDLKVDAYCSKCNKLSTFRRCATKEEELENQPISKSVAILNSYCADEEEFEELEDPEDIIKNSFLNFIDTNEIFGMLFKCAREEEHIMKFDFYIDKSDRILYKIGQYPSIATLNNSKEILKYKKYLGKFYKEFSKAIGLYSHGIGIGSFVYLRRIFEYLIENIHQDIKTHENWDEDQEKEYQKMRMDGKIKFLERYLPCFLVDHRSRIYGILSKGIHELPEKDCLKYFPVLKNAIILILQEQYSRNENKRILDSMSSSLNEIYSDLK